MHEIHHKDRVQRWATISSHEIRWFDKEMNLTEADVKRTMHPKFSLVTI